MVGDFKSPLLEASSAAMLFLTLWIAKRLQKDHASGQLDRLEGADDVVGTFVLKEALVEPGSEIPMIALIILVAIKPPDAAHDDEAADPIVPEIAEVMEAEVGPGKGTLKTDVVVDDHL